MRVALITENFLPKLDGVTRTLARLLEHLQLTGHQALLLGPDSGMERYAGAEVLGTAGIPLPFYPELRVNFFRPLFVRRLYEFRPDIIHVVDPVILGATGLAAARLLGTPIVSSYHTNLAAYCTHFGFPLLTRPMWFYNRFIHNQCELTFCPSASTATMLRQQGFTHIRIWPRGVDTALFTPQRRSAELRARWLQDKRDKCLLLYVGRLSYEKNLRLLVEAYKGMSHERCHLVLVGDGPAAAELRQELATVPVTFTGYLQGEELATAYASADLFAFPSTTETFGQAALEALASGLPVVGLQAEGICDLVTDGSNGLLLELQGKQPEEQIRLYRAALERLIEQEPFRLQLGENARRAASRYSWFEAMECLLQGYRDVMQRTAPLVAA
ncbi:glycosyltransferase involved in cell wall biosynthesis [Thermosporothrix hazakensis]|uniref:Glycosyltransferase involved in cell wall biosynthesis n=2 Tax=Thermosporothrix TaxID=768650 RepID=A0A326U3G7_THEHA|nr:glycosyltransferase family 1 protein [Thermosporothrix hazakensis]PZW26629.1 glycosyltransferase involved in cell wall biosynthesis [Thermosporothrix hazakensis]BBH89487.1 glycosyl transferase family 1 [Thermosporothrix sp. COM3]GCE47670.1 glycosyl transferase family 1 [Thermosporothrix hazakensis]